MSSWVAYAIMVSLGSTLLHASSKMMKGIVDPMIASMIAGIFFIIIPVFMFVWNKEPVAFYSISVKGWFWAVLYGLAVALANVAVIFMYKSGAPMSIAVPLTRTAVMCLAVFVGLLFFAESLTAIKMLGIVFSIFGLVLMSL